MIEILDTTLRDGEQTSGVSFVIQEKLSILRLLIEELHIDRVEIASARVSSGELESVRKMCSWAASRNALHRIEVLGFVDGGISIDWITQAGGKVINLLCKGSEKHCRLQLRKTPEEHIAEIIDTIARAQERDIEVNVYLEDWSNGMMQSPDYVYQLTDALVKQPIKRIMLPDTLGVLNPYNTYDFCRSMIKRYPNTHFDFHAHNDYDLATANVFSAAKAGVKGLHTTINGLGERAGNAPLSSVLTVLHDQLKLRTHVVEKSINSVSRVVESYSGVKIPANAPVIGESVFTQCAGIHADGDNKSNLYYNDLLPERFGRTRQYALGKLSGRANIRKNLEALGIDLDENSMSKVTARIIELGDKKELVTQQDLPYIIADVLKHTVGEQRVRLLNYSLSIALGLRPAAVIKIEIAGTEYEESAMGDGQYDAFMKALRRIYTEHLHRDLPILTNYTVDIPPGGRTDAFVRTVITWEYRGESFKTHALDADQTEAAIQATLKMLNKIEINPHED